jgi:copper transport protein
MPRRLVAAAVIAISLAASAPDAGAHASLERSEPAPSASLPESPERVLLDFDEAVDAGTTEIRLLDATGAETDVGQPVGDAADPTIVTSTVPPLAEGAYVVAWRIVSTDGHPVSGAFPFQVGDAAPIDTSGLVAQTLDEQQGDPAVEALLTVARLVGYVGLALLVGGYAFVRRIWPAAGASRPARRTMIAGWVAAAVGALGTFLLTGPYVRGGPLGDALDPAVWSDLLDGRTGRAVWVRLLLAGLAGVVVMGLDRRPTAAGEVARIGVLGALLATYSIDGHESAGRWVALAVIDHAVHLVAMSLWLGGLALLVVCLASTDRAVPAPGGVPLARAVGAAVIDADTASPVPEPDGRATAVRRFSRLAQWCVVALVITGFLEAWRLLDRPGALFDTTYGRTLTVKLVLVAALVGLGAWSRHLVRARARPDQLWRSVVTEVAVALAVLAVTATLVDTSPSEAVDSEPVHASLVQGDVILDLTLTPAAVGENEVHLTFSPPGGGLQEVTDVEVRLTAEGRPDLGPVPVELTPAGPNHAIGYGVQLPYAGDWTIEVLATAPDGARLRYSTIAEVAS